MKLEPSDAAKILVPTAHVSSSAARKIDRLIRKGRLDDAHKAADTAVLVNALGLSIETVCSIQRVLAGLQRHTKTNSPQKADGAGDDCSKTVWHTRLHTIKENGGQAGPPIRSGTAATSVVAGLS